MTEQIRTKLLILGAMAVVLAGCGLIELGVETKKIDVPKDKPVALGRYFTRGEDKVCAIHPGAPSSPLDYIFAPQTLKDALAKQQTGCRVLNVAYMPTQMFLTEETVVVGLKNCRAGQVYKFRNAARVSFDLKGHDFCVGPNDLYAKDAQSGPELAPGPHEEPKE